MNVINYDQWVKAGGQYKYPWGDEFKDVCVLESRNAFGKWKHVQPSGSLENCVSEHGVYDQLGNAWEWADLGRTATRDEWVDYLRSHGVEVEVNQSWIEISERDSNKLKVSGFCVMMEGLTIDDEEAHCNLREPISQGCTTRSKGCLWFDPLASKTDEGSQTEFQNQVLCCQPSCGPIEWWDKVRMQNLWVPRLVVHTTLEVIPFCGLCGSVIYRVLMERLAFELYPTLCNGSEPDV